LGIVDGASRPVVDAMFFATERRSAKPGGITLRQEVKAIVWVLVLVSVRVLLGNVARSVGF
jgi:hypothetical protein